MDPSVTDFIAREARFGARNYEPLGVVLSRGEGVFVWDTQGHRYLDCLSAYSAVNQGHCHPKILAAMVQQASASPSYHLATQLGSTHEKRAVRDWTARRINPTRLPKGGLQIVRLLRQTGND